MTLSFRLSSSAFAACALSVLMSTGACGGSIIIVGDGGPSTSGDDGSGSSNGDDSSTGTGTGTSSGSNIFVDPCPPAVPTPGSSCREPGQGCSYHSLDASGNPSCYAVACDGTSHWQYAPAGCP
jgi:hypothetical protein